MAPTASQPPAHENRGDRAWTVFRERARGLLEQQRARVAEVEASLAAQLEALRNQLENDPPAAAGKQDCEQLEARITALARERDQVAEARREAEALLEEARVVISDASRQQQDLRDQIAETKKQLDARSEELDQLRSQQAAATADADDPRVGQLEAELAELRGERDQLLKRLDQLDKINADGQQLDDLRSRFEMAVQEVRELKASNAELEDQLATARTASQPADNGHSGAFDWEDHKRRLVEKLESDFDDSDPDQASEKLTVEGTIRITDQVVAEKEQEIQELKQLLENQSSNIGEVAVGAAAIAEMLDQDELIRQERENLRQQQEEWREKLRQAEIDISVERAKLARQRVELQEEIQALDRQRAAFEEAAPAKGSDAEAAQKPRGRWLSRLGLKDDD